MLSCTEYRTYEGAKSGLEVAKGRNQKPLWVALLEIVTARLETKSGQRTTFQPLADFGQTDQRGRDKAV